MVSSLLSVSFINPTTSLFISPDKFKAPLKPYSLPIASCWRRTEQTQSVKNDQDFSQALHLVESRFIKSVIPLAASLAVFLWSNPAHAGILSGFSGIESVPGPEIPEISFLRRFNEENQKRYAENDARFKESPILKKLLEQTKLNKEKNRQAILDKYCIRGAEWGVGDCSTEGMSPEERENFIAMLKQKAGVE